MRPLRILALLVLAALGAASALYLKKNPEKARLDEAARRAAPGKFVQLADGYTHYDITGPDSGHPVVLVHGFSVPSYIWDSTAVALSRAGYRVIRYDVYGRGWSDRPDVDYDGALFDRQLDGLLDSLHVTEPVHLMGLSFGGFVTGHYVPGHVARVRTLTLVDPVASSSPVPAFMGWPLVGTWIWQVTRVPGMADNQASDFLHPEHWPDWADRYRPQMQYKGFGRALLRSGMTSGRTNFDSLYAAVGRSGVPVLLVWGKQDQTVPIAKAEVLQRAIPSLEFLAVDSAGHLPHMEQPLLVHTRMRAFLGAHDTGAQDPAAAPPAAADSAAVKR